MPSAALYGVITDVDGYVTNGPLGMTVFENGTAEVFWWWDKTSTGQQCVFNDEFFTVTEGAAGAVTLNPVNKSGYYWFNATRGKDAAGETMYNGSFYNPGDELCGTWSALAGAPAKAPSCLSGSTGWVV